MCYIASNTVDSNLTSIARYLSPAITSIAVETGTLLSGIRYHNRPLAQLSPPPKTSLTAPIICCILTLSTPPS